MKSVTKNYLAVLSFTSISSHVNCLLLQLNLKMEDEYSPVESSPPKTIKSLSRERLECPLSFLGNAGPEI